MTMLIVTAIRGYLSLISTNDGTTHEGSVATNNPLKSSVTIRKPLMMPEQK